MKIPFPRSCLALLLWSGAGCVAAVDAEPGMLGRSAGGFVVYPDPFGDGRENPAKNVRGSAEARAMSPGHMRLVLKVTGLPPDRTFGSHLHKLGCEEMKAGGHYQHQASASATDPKFANADNEAWLDFATNGAGAGEAIAEVEWTPRAGEARAIMIHNDATKEGGVAGAKLACLPMLFDLPH